MFEIYLVALVHAIDDLLEFVHPLYVILEHRPSTASAASGGGASGGPTTKKRRHSVLMDTSVKNFQRLLNNAGEHMRTEVENLPLRIYE